MLTLRTVTLALSLVVGSAIGVAGQDEEADLLAPAAFTAIERSGAMHADETGAMWREYRLEATDPRASGLVTHGWNEGSVGDDWHMSLGLYPGVVRLVNDDGAWTGTSTGVSAFEDEDPLLIASVRFVHRFVHADI